MRTTSFLKIIVPIFIFIWNNPCTAQQSKDIYVSPLGSDSNSGTKGSPYKTLYKVIERLGSLEAYNQNKIIVWLQDGTYRIRKPITIDLNIKHHKVPVEFKSVPGSKPIISGSETINNWTYQGEGVWVSTLPEHLGHFRELFVQGKRSIRARHPNKGYNRVQKVGADRRTNFTYNPSDFPLPNNPEQVELVVLHDWSITRIPVSDIAVESRTISAVDWIGAKGLDFFNLDHWEPNPRYYLENALEFLDVEYEWYLDNVASKIYLKLPRDSDPSQLTIEVPLAESLLLVEGSEKHPISNISFEGIQFKHCRYNLPNKIYAGIQATHFDTQRGKKEWAVVPAAVQTSWANNISFTNCEFTSLGGGGIWLGTGSKNCSIKNSSLWDISGNGIMIGEGRDRLVNGKPWWKIATEQAALGNRVQDCKIWDCGLQFYGAVGIWCGLTAETELRYNEIYNLPYTGISIGWMWSPEATPCRDNIIANNHIHHVMQKLSDGGGIYMLGLQPGSKLLNNHIHDISVNAGRAESNGMFLDEGTKDVLVKGNLIYNIAKSPLRFHRASTNMVKNNHLFTNGSTPGVAYNNTLPENIHQEGNREISTDDPNYKVALKKAVSKHTPTPKKP
ncbi:right-handed parallel beta-helix repeat-containing protein [Arenibacter aquaticus]|uniref:Right-handed parallel beta-helix repeat-containing protein n=1 Tax=Arenibacter aquaticus TaxID=2489054 RepID=A0A430K8M4_9FLAO|nr:right-handed parallel beta-helix repeat-containing protein [Arenibacter aquaticus]RTE55415.1 right-handed parallel beta-helix repeat-containing protein [Arenibacter aquaticus]